MKNLIKLSVLLLAVTLTSCDNSPSKEQLAREKSREIYEAKRDSIDSLLKAEEERMQFLTDSLDFEIAKSIARGGY